MFVYSEIIPSDITILPNGPSSSDSLAPNASSVNVTFIDPIQKTPLKHYLLPPTFEVAVENSSVITGFTVGLRSNETGLGITRIYLSPEIEGIITSRIWKESDDGVLEMIVEVKTAGDTATDSVWIIKDSLGDFLSRNWIFILIGVVLISSVAIVSNYVLNKRIASKSKTAENLK